MIRRAARKHHQKFSSYVILEMAQIKFYDEGEEFKLEHGGFLLRGKLHESLGIAAEEKMKKEAQEAATSILPVWDHPGSVVNQDTLMITDVIGEIDADKKLKGDNLKSNQYKLKQKTLKDFMVIMPSSKMYRVVNSGH